TSHTHPHRHARSLHDALPISGKCFNTQVTYVLPIDAEAGKFIYMGDRWNGNNLTDSRTVWLPLQVNPDTHTIAILGESDWTLDRSEEHTSELQSRFDLVCRLL